jgi:hypothetical protein
MEMFNKESQRERIGKTLQKSDSLKPLKEVEKYFLKAMRRYKTKADYDVIANELPYFETLNYTEYANCFIIHPLNNELRVKQMYDAGTNDGETQDWVKFFREKILGGESNKYDAQQNTKEYEKRDNIVVLVGSNKLKERICLNKLRWIKRKHGEDVYFKAHPLTTHQLIGELKDIFGDDTILPRSADLYSFFVESETIYTSHLSESAVYAIALAKDIEPIDVYSKIEMGSFFHINRFLFEREARDAQEWVNRAFSDARSGVINPAVDEDWKKKIDDYLEYIHDERDKHEHKYV